MSIKNGTSMKEKTIPGKFKRLNYTHGMLLTEDDLNAEQRYFRDHNKLQNRLLGDGVVWGLCLRVPDEHESKNGTIDWAATVVLECGVAVDCAGNIICVAEDYNIHLDDFLKELQRLGQLKLSKDDNERETDCIDPDSLVQQIYIGIKYSECQSDPRQQFTSNCPDDPLSPAFSRTREGYEVVLLTNEDLFPTESGMKTNSLRNNLRRNCTPCPPKPVCCDEDLVVIVGCIDLKEDPFKITAAEINVRRGRKLLEVNGSPLNKPARDFNKARNIVLCEFASHRGLYDLSRLIGMSVGEASAVLRGISDHVYPVAVKISDLDDTQPDKIRDASPFVNLSIDPEGRNVLDVNLVHAGGGDDGTTDEAPVMLAYFAGIGPPPDDR